MQNKFLIATAFTISAHFIQSCNDSAKTSSATTEMDSTMNSGTMNDTMSSTRMDMDHSMDGMKMTGDFDYDFAKTMIVHHQAAIDMAQVEISKGSNPEMKSLAENIVKAQKSEIDQFDNILKDYKMPEMKKDAGEGHNELGEIMEKMETKMKGMEKTGNADKDFAMMMIPHHESAVQMGSDQLSHGKNLELKKMAQKIVEDQSREIRQLQAWLAKNK
ncbi:MAG: DUF305 domain-containing protein [Gloeobacteraceae cyanobacterium ES-bin-316]|nr:DUF305 domain-containing protein [Ferruginibacter sp.]